MMALSATKIGNKHGLTAQETNQLLKIQGFLDGEPNNWAPTEKAMPYVHEDYQSRGTGGYKQYNPSWVETRYDADILKELDFSQAAKQAAREAAAEARRKKREQRDQSAVVLTELSDVDVQDGDNADDFTAKVVGGVVGLLVAGGVILYNNAPAIKEKIRDRFSIMRRKIQIRSNTEKKTQEEKE